MVNPTSNSEAPRHGVNGNRLARLTSSLAPAKVRDRAAAGADSAADLGSWNGEPGPQEQPENLDLEDPGVAAPEEEVVPDPGQQRAYHAREVELRRVQRDSVGHIVALHERR